MRIFSDKPNLMVFKDNLSGGEVGLLYRMPTTQERVGYAAEGVIREAGEVKNNLVATRIKYGMAICEGLRDGDFAVPGADGEAQAISSTPGSDHYCPDWKQHLERYGADLVELLAVQVFDVPVQAVKKAAEKN